MSLNTDDILETNRDYIKTESIEFYLDLKSIPSLEISKCGEIFVSQIGKFQFLCGFCHKKYNSCKNYASHIIKDHLNININAHFLFEMFSNDAENDTEILENVKTMANSNHTICNEPNKPHFTNTNSNKEVEQQLTNILKSPIQNSWDDDISDNNNIDDYKLNASNNSEDKLFKCKICTKKLARKCDYTRHLNWHERETNNQKKIGKRGRKPILDGDIKCKLCNKGFKYEDDAMRHEENFCPRRKKYVCEECGKGYDKRITFEEHKRIHTGERPFQCELCPKSFIGSNYLTQHMKHHFNDKRYQCQYCDKKFFESTKRKLHEMIHTNDFPFQCEFCEKKFRCKSKLNVHLKRHINDRIHKCDLCDKRFFDINLLRAHAACHSDDKPFACEICPARFPRKGALRLHRKLHSEVKNYVCKVCSKDFAQYNGIYSHMKTHGIKYSSEYEKTGIFGKAENIN